MHEPSPLRLLRLQRLARDLGLDGLVFVTGVDGSFNLGSQQAASFMAGKSQRDVVAGGGGEDSIEVLVVTQQEARVCCPKASSLVKELCQHAQHQVFSPTAAEAEDPDACEEAKLGAFVQMLRGLSRVGMAVGVPPEGSTARSSPTAHALAPDRLMALEQWPLLMAYGMEGVGRAAAPFVTQCFQVHDVYEALHAHVYAPLDAAAVRQALQADAAHLLQHWGHMLKGISSQPASNLASLTEQQVLEPLQAFFTYGTLRALPGVPQEVRMPPRVVFGPRSNDEHAVADAAVTMASASLAAGPGATHLVVEAADGHSGLRAARTYFFSTGSVARDMFADPDEEQEEGFSWEAATQGWDPAATLSLMRVYTALVEAARAGMDHFALQEGATVGSTRVVVQEVLAARCAALGVPQPALAQRLRFGLWQTDHANHVQEEATRGSRSLKVLRVSLLDVRAPAGGAAAGGGLLGALTYADTFLEVPAAGARPAALLVLTEAVPALVAWPGVGCEGVLQQRAAASFAKALAAAASNNQGAALAAATRKAQRRARHQQQALARLALSKAQGKQPRGGFGDGQRDDKEEDQDEDEVEVQQEEQEDEQLAAHWGEEGPLRPALPAPLGQLLTVGGGDDAVLLTGSPVAPAEPGSLHCFARGLVFVPARTRAVWVLDFLQELEAITITQLEATTPGAAGSELVVLRGKQPCCGFPPACHLNTCTQLAIPLAAMTQAARRHMMTVVLPAWQQTCREGAPPAPGEPSVPIAYVKDPTAGSPFPPECSASYVAAVQVMHEGAKSWPQVVAADAAVDSLLGQLDDSELEQLGGLWPGVEQLLGSAASAAPGTPAVTLLVGLPGADQALVAQTLVGMIGPAAAPQVVRIPSTGGGAAGAAAWQAALATGLAANSLSQHLVVVSEGFVPLVQQLAWLAGTHAVQEGRCFLASVVGCVHALSVWEDKPRAVLQTGLAAQLPAGFLDALVISAGSAAEFKQAQAALCGVVALQGPAAPQVLRGGSPQLLVHAHDQLLPPRQERLARLSATAAMRRWAYWPPPPTGQQGTVLQVAPPLRGPLQAVQLSFSGELHVQVLGDALQQLAGPPTTSPALPLQEATPPAAPAAAPAAAVSIECAVQALRASGAQVQGVAGVVRASLGAPLQQLTWGLAAAKGGAWELRASSSALPQLSLVHGVPAASVVGSDVAPGGELLVWGTRLEVPALQALLQAASKAAQAAQKQQQLQSEQAVVTVASLSAAEVAAVAEAHKFDPLPEGHTFDGCRYYDEFGSSSSQHPCLERFLAEHCAQRTQQQGAAAQQVDASVSAASAHALRMAAVAAQVLTA